MPVTQYLPFATAGTANTLTYSAYAALTSMLDDGHQPGIALSEVVNTTFRQVSVGVAGLAKFATDYGVLSCLDDGNHVNFALALKSAIDAIVASTVPAGAIQSFAASTPPVGWLEAAGQSVSRATYAALFLAIGTTYGSVDGTSFNLPDARGRVLRGWDHSAGRDPGRVFGSVQDDAIQNITGSFGASSSDTVSLAGGTGAFVHDGPVSPQWGADPKPNEPGFTFDASRVVRTDPNETRVKNIAVLICIKY